MVPTPTAQNSHNSERHESAVVAVEALILSVVRGLFDVTRSIGSSSHQATPAAIDMSDPSHNLVAEDGNFCVATDRKRRLEFAPRNYRRLVRLCVALDAVHRLNSSGRTATQRELFYRAAAEADGKLFREQKDMNKALLDVVGALGIGRPHLGVLTSEKGLIAGAVNFRDPQTLAVSSALKGACGVAVSEAMLNSCNEHIEVNAAHCILVVEKDTYFQYLLQGRLLSSLPLVLVTGRGYPDLLTRRLLQRLQRTAPQLPQIYLGDYDPHGVSIFLRYRASLPELRWLGLHYADVQGLPSEAALPLTGRDSALQARLLQRMEVVSHSGYVQQLRSMDRKFELEALHAVCGAEEISGHFWPQKILRRAWL